MNDTAKVRILSDAHEHEDKKVPKGTVLDVNEKTAEHLVAVGAAEMVSPTPAPIASPKFTGGAE